MHNADQKAQTSEPAKQRTIWCVVDPKASGPFDKVGTVYNTQAAANWYKRQDPRLRVICFLEVPQQEAKDNG